MCPRNVNKCEEAWEKGPIGSDHQKSVNPTWLEYNMLATYDINFKIVSKCIINFLYRKQSAMRQKCSQAYDQHI